MENTLPNGSDSTMGHYCLVLGFIASIRAAWPGIPTELCDEKQTCGFMVRSLPICVFLANLRYFLGDL